MEIKIPIVVTRADVLPEGIRQEFQQLVAALQRTITFLNYQGTGSPEGVVFAPRGATYRDETGGAGTCFYVKESGSANANSSEWSSTGWVAK